MHKGEICEKTRVFRSADDAGPGPGMPLASVKDGKSPISTTALLNVFPFSFSEITTRSYDTCSQHGVCGDDRCLFSSRKK